MMKRRLRSSEDTSRKLVEIVQAKIADPRYPHAYTGATNSVFIRADGSVGVHRWPGLAAVQAIAGSSYVE